jgi:hypothetical protein
MIEKEETSAKTSTAIFSMAAKPFWCGVFVVIDIQRSFPRDQEIARSTIWRVEHRVEDEGIFVRSPLVTNFLTIRKGNCTTGRIALSDFNLILKRQAKLFQ